MLPSHALLNPSPPSVRLSYPSELYDSLRASLVQAELIVLRSLGFELRLQTPFNYLYRYVARAVSSLGGERDKIAVEEWDDLSTNRREEYKIVELEDTGLGKDAAALALKALVYDQLCSELRS